MNINEKWTLKTTLSIVALLFAIPNLYFEYELIQHLFIYPYHFGGEEFMDRAFMVVFYPMTIGLLAIALGTYTYRFNIIGKLAVIISVSPLVVVPLLFAIK